MSEQQPYVHARINELEETVEAVQLFSDAVQIDKSNLVFRPLFHEKQWRVDPSDGSIDGLATVLSSKATIIRSSKESADIVIGDYKFRVTYESN